MSKLQSYCGLLYERMDAEATIQENVRVWSGRLISTCKEIGIPEGTYSKVANKLRSMGCIEQVNRGYRGNQLSTFILHVPPTGDLWEQDFTFQGLTTGPSLDRLRSSVEDLRKQLGGINIVDALANVEGRLQKLETAIKTLQDNQPQ